MATTCLASAIFPLSVELVWKHLREFTFPRELMNSIVKDVVVDNSSKNNEVGSVRTITWHTGEIRKHKMLELNDLKHIITWELLESNVPQEVMAVISSISCKHISEHNHTLVQWSTEYSADVSPSLIKFDQNSFHDNLQEIRVSIMQLETPQKLGVLYHVTEAPSSRVLWLANELGIPIVVKELHTPALRSSSDTELPTTKGGVVTTYHENEMTLVESGAIIMYLLEKFDEFHTMIPPRNTTERAKFWQFFFYTSSTVDHLLFDAYKHMYVIDSGSFGEETASNNKKIWDENVAIELAKPLKEHKYICGSQFTAADVMVGWCCYFANLLGWLQNHKELKQYYDNLLKRRACRKALFGHEVTTFN